MVIPCKHYEVIYSDLKCEICIIISLFELTHYILSFLIRKK